MLRDDPRDEIGEIGGVTMLQQFKIEAAHVVELIAKIDDDENVDAALFHGIEKATEPRAPHRRH